VSDRDAWRGVAGAIEVDVFHRRGQSRSGDV
jgi:hypothetical protein